MKGLPGQNFAGTRIDYIINETLEFIDRDEPQEVVCLNPRSI